jgi:hypothetical protein
VWTGHNGRGAASAAIVRWCVCMNRTSVWPMAGCNLMKGVCEGGEASLSVKLAARQSPGVISIAVS